MTEPVHANPRDGTRERLMLAASGLVLLLVGLAIKFLAPPSIRASVGGIPYVALWGVVFRFVATKAPAYACAAAAFALTCLFELMQLWHPPWLEWIRSYTLGALVLGTSFDWVDFPAYAAGGLLCWALLAAIARRTAGSS